jgi:hypothetical protein
LNDIIRLSSVGMLIFFSTVQGVVLADRIHILVQSMLDLHMHLKVL